MVRKTDTTFYLCSQLGTLCIYYIRSKVVGENITKWPQIRQKHKKQCPNQDFQSTLGQVIIRGLSTSFQSSIMSVYTKSSYQGGAPGNAKKKKKLSPKSSGMYKVKVIFPTYAVSFVIFPTYVIVPPWSSSQWRRGVVVIATARLHSTKPELRFCTG